MAPDFPRIVCIGEALTDLIRSDDDQWHSRVGGSIWNVARVLASMGVPVGFAGAISQDIFGDALWRASVAAGLDMRFLQRNAKSPLLAVVATTTPPSYFFIGDDSADLHFDPQQLPHGWQPHLQWAHFGGISLARQPLATTLLALAAQLKAAGVRISYDPNFRNLMDRRYDATLQQMAALADVIKISDEDLRGLFRSDDTDAAFARLRSINPDALYLYTRGRDGASLYLGQQVWHAAAPIIDVIDTVGAGDASIAGLLFSLIEMDTHSWQQHLHFALASGAAACMSRGAHAPTREQILALFTDLQT